MSADAIARDRVPRDGASAVPARREGWWELAARMAALVDPTPFRAAWLSALARMSAAHLRSPAFLALMRFNLALIARPAPAPRRAVQVPEQEQAVPMS